MTTSRLAKSSIELTYKTPAQMCEQQNRYIVNELRRDDIEWVVEDGKPKLRFKKSALAMNREAYRNRKDVMDRRGLPMSESDTFKLNKELERLGATKRYRPDGSKYDA